MKPVCAGDCIKRGIYRVHSRFARAVNFGAGNDLVSLVDSSIGEGPLNIVLDTLDGMTAATESLTITDDEFLLDEMHISRANLPVFNSYVNEAISCSANRNSIALFSSFVQEHASPESLAFLLGQIETGASTPGASASPPTYDNALRARASEGARALRTGDIERGTTLLKGIGFGLTPSGDDFLAGYMVGLRCSGPGSDNEIEGIWRLVSGEIPANPISHAFLRCAREGRVSGAWKKLIVQLFSSGGRLDSELAMRVLSFGETSGADFATGFIFGARELC